MNKNNKGGRPKKSPSEKRRYSLLVRLNTTERYTLLRKAKVAGVSRVDFVRELILGGQIQARIQPEEMQQIRIVAGVANNLNQLTHRLHQLGVSFLLDEVRVLQQLINELLQRLRP